MHQIYLKVHTKPKKNFQDPIYLWWLEIAEDNPQCQYMANVVTYNFALEVRAVVTGSVW